MRLISLVLLSFIATNTVALYTPRMHQIEKRSPLPARGMRYQTPNPNHDEAMDTSDSNTNNEEAMDTSDSNTDHDEDMQIPDSNSLGEPMGTSVQSPILPGSDMNTSASNPILPGGATGTSTPNHVKGKGKGNAGRSGLAWKKISMKQ
ncbi:hypothetical protein BASA50_008402 [Batrachochytrium salamandrivorans]|uniref:Uncharacterized protein n=1 Tax=Batrachochytrium salamandrivorans TaxID=1357716 RepID=A0ABQ8F463_9FUNG|nr:hypothetical protein BASA62_003796 [Batrachochytrium salamandrivorans]KAH6575986.1 hypothetical protein BASA60_004711 [Batrachochytrium salamandrivorans]KAH6583214.1 hypothetical protein BASA61_008108 [Batrachochytrium salamandrivorans]KAH6591888.1 hypothetical protein BASA50_008402 [Batrachochytrium salamandrivorans]